jgi:hypothetical protein
MYLKSRDMRTEAEQGAWAYTATPEQMEVLLSLPDLFNLIYDEKCDYVFAEVYGKNPVAPGFHGYRLTVYWREDRNQSVTYYYQGVPGSYGAVLMQLRKQRNQLMEKIEAAGE